eukprot:jgi/Botrbrau1/21316/Bobra.0184s0027.1
MHADLHGGECPSGVRSWEVCFRGLHMLHRRCLQYCTLKVCLASGKMLVRNGIVKVWAYGVSTFAFVCHCYNFWLEQCMDILLQCLQLSGSCWVLRPSYSTWHMLESKSAGS